MPPAIRPRAGRACRGEWDRGLPRPRSQAGTCPRRKQQGRTEGGALGQPPAESPARHPTAGKAVGERRSQEDARGDHGLFGRAAANAEGNEEQHDEPEQDVQQKRCFDSRHLFASLPRLNALLGQSAAMLPVQSSPCRMYAVDGAVGFAGDVAGPGSAVFVESVASWLRSSSTIVVNNLHWCDNIGADTPRFATRKVWHGDHCTEKGDVRYPLYAIAASQAPRRRRVTSRSPQPPRQRHQQT